MFENNAALFSFLGLIACGIATAIIFVWLRFCYYPGGYKKNEVIDLGDYAMIVVAQNAEKKRADKYAEQYTDYTSHQDGDEEMYYDATPRSNHSGDTKEWYSVGAGEQDVEGSYFEERSASSPSLRSVSDGQGAYEVSQI